MNRLILISIAFILLAGCKKENEAGSVYVRIQNSSTTLFSNINVANVEFGSIPPSATSRYKLMTQPLYAAMCNASTNDSSFEIGYGVCGTPMPAPFESGKYTFVIKPSPTYPGYYDLEAKRD